MPTLTAGSPVELDQYRYLEDVAWPQYESMLEAIGDGALRVTYDNGRMEVMSPLHGHEREKNSSDHSSKLSRWNGTSPCGVWGQ